MGLFKKHYKHHSTIDTLPIVQYHRYITTGDGRYFLVLRNIHELPNVKIDLKEVIADMEYQLSDMAINKSSKASYMHNRSKRVLSMSAEYEYINNVIYALRFGYNEQLAAELNKCGYRVKEASLQSDLDRAKSKSNTLLTRIAILKQDIDNANGEGGSSSVDDEVTSLLQYAGLTMLDYNNMTTAQYMSMKYRALENANKKGVENG
jgi:hypothetical protein